MSLNPSQISSHIKNKDFLVAEDAIIRFIQFNKDDKNTLVLAKPVTENILQNVSDTNKIENEIVEQLCNEYATVISELFCHPQYKPSNNIINWFLTCKFVIEWLFSASIWKNTDAIIEHLGLVKLDKFGQIKLNTNIQKLTLLLALILLSSKFKLPWKLLFKANPAIALSSYIGLVTQPIPALSAETNKGFNHLLESAKDLPILDLPVLSDLGKLNYVFFNCSYATSPNKYEFKKWLTSLIRHNLYQWLDDTTKNYIASMATLNLTERPKVAVMLELYSKNHAMFRCFNKMFINLSQQYQLIAFIDERDLAEADLSAFDNVVTFNNVFDMNKNAKLIINEKPDIIFYPSIGMKFWGIYLSQLRLAPLQVMMSGHPSSSYSPEIDYLIILQNSFSVSQLQAVMNEKIITADKAYKDISTHTLHDALTPEYLAQHNQFLASDTEITVGINGVLTKVTYDLIDVCKKIQRGSSKKVNFVFFSMHKSNQLAFIAAKKQLSKELKNIELVCFSDFLSYMKTVSQCHFLLPTLPFGGSNSNIDAMLLNKPKLYLRGKSQIYTMSDQWEWERVDLDAELGCDSIDELVEKSILLIDDFSYREKLHHLLVKNCTIDRVIGKGNDQYDLFEQVFSKIIKQTL
tara:strand:+ start:7240 stop:9138 length:1899 start_codon:yes stop_codon:yes gene_type:complete